MSVQVTGTVISDKNAVAVDKVRHEVYGKTPAQDVDVCGAQREQHESRPLSRRKRWVVTRVVAKAPRGLTMIQMRLIFCTLRTPAPGRSR